MAMFWELPTFYMKTLWEEAMNPNTSEELRWQWVAKQLAEETINTVNFKQLKQHPHMRTVDEDGF